LNKSSYFKPVNWTNNILNFRKLVFITCIIFSLPAIAEELATALSAYEQGDYQIAYEKFTQLAKQNNAEAQYNLAFMYFGGEGITQDDEKAAYWFKQAAKLAHAGAQDKLAYLYLHGRGLIADRIQAYAWYRVAAENGIFLAKNISENLKKGMNTEERIHADLLSSEYIKEYRKK
jgi:TPR repeat protein